MAYSTHHSRAHHIGQSYLLHIMLIKPPLQPSFEMKRKMVAHQAILSYLILWTTFAPDRVQLVDEDDGRLFLACGGEQITYSLGADTDEHFVEFGPTGN